jgi:hypothetical protein
MRETARRAMDRPSGQPDRAPSGPSNPALSLQRTVGNRAARSILAREPVPIDSGTTQKASSVTIADLGSVSVLSWSFGSNPVGGATSSRARDVHFTSRSGVISPKLLQAVATGKHFESAVLTTSRMTITFKGVTLSNYTSGSGTGDSIDSWSLYYTSVDYTTTDGG